ALPMAKVRQIDIRTSVMASRKNLTPKRRAVQPLSKPSGRTALSVIDINKVLTNVSTVVDKVVASTQPPVALPRPLLGTLVQTDSGLGSNLQIEVRPTVQTSGASGKKPAATIVSGSQVIATGRTDSAANFAIPFPPGAVLLSGTSLSLRLRGSAPDAVVDIG